MTTLWRKITVKRMSAKKQKTGTSPAYRGKFRCTPPALDWAFAAPGRCYRVRETDTQNSLTV